MIAHDEISPEQQAIFQRMEPEQRWIAARQLYWTMRSHKAAFLKSRNPDWTDEQIRREVRHIFLNARN